MSGENRKKLVNSPSIAYFRKLMWKSQCETAGACFNCTKNPENIKKGQIKNVPKIVPSFTLKMEDTRMPRPCATKHTSRLMVKKPAKRKSSSG
jgi:hypothetical protein